jgi:hypothetical protein
MKTIVIDGKVYDWKAIRELRRAQINEARRIQQLPLFELKQDCRPLSQKTADGRFTEPLLFKE